MNKVKLLILVNVILVIIGLAVVFFFVNSNDEVENVSIYDQTSKQTAVTNSNQTTKKFSVKLTDNFFNGMVNEIFINSNNYINKTITYEGFVYYNKEGTLGVLRKYYCCGVDASLVGFECEFDGKKPEANSWVKVEGIIQSKKYENENIPYVKITNLEVLEKRGLDTVNQ